MLEACSARKKKKKERNQAFKKTLSEWSLQLHAMKIKCLILIGLQVYRWQQWIEVSWGFYRGNKYSNIQGEWLGVFVILFKALRQSFQRSFFIPWQLCLKINNRLCSVNKYSCCFFLHFIVFFPCPCMNWPLKRKYSTGNQNISVLSINKTMASQGNSETLALLYCKTMDQSFPFTT